MGKKLLSILLSLCMFLSLLPISVIASENDFSDMPARDHWSYKAIISAVENGLLQGNNGKLMPEENLTRAQLAAILNRAFGAEETANISAYSDVGSSSWYYTDIAKAVRMGTLRGTGAGIMRPDDPVTRQEAFVVLARAIKLADADKAALGLFLDKNIISSWAVPGMAAMVQAGYVNGSGGRLNPANVATREEFAQLMYNIFSLYISKPGTYSNNVSGNVLINADDVTLKGMIVAGDLIIGEGVGNGNITLDDVSVTGRLVVRAGGENSIRIINSSNVGSIIVGKTGDGGVRIHTEEGCRVEVIYVDDGLDNVILEGAYNQVTISTDTPVVLRDAMVAGLTVSGKKADVKLEGITNVSVTLITENAAGATLEVGSKAKVTKVESTAESVIISGSGSVIQAVIGGDNTAVNTSGTKVTAGEGATGITQNGKAVETNTSSGNSSGGSSGGSTGDPSGGSPGGDSASYTVAVTTVAELQSALSNASVSAITIRESITILEGTTVTFNKPVTIADLPGVMLIICGDLINDSTFINRGLGGFFGDTGIQLDGSFVNNGTFTNETRFGMFKASFTNNGTINNKSWLHCAGTHITNNQTFSSIGDLSLLNSDSFDGEDNIPSTFVNSANATLVAEGSGSIQLAYTCSFTNNGTVMSGGNFYNYGAMTNSGSFTYTGYLLNTGSITGDLTASGEKPKWENDRPVTNLTELKDQLTSLDPGYDGIAIIGDITLSEDLAINRYVLITPSGRLKVPEGYTLTVFSDLGYNELKVSGKLEISGTLETMRSGSGDDEKVGQITIVGGALSATSSYTITNNGVILLISGEINPEDIHVSGNGIDYFKEIFGVTTEEELHEAMNNSDVNEIAICGDITLTTDLNITKTTTLAYDTLAPKAYALNIPSDVTVAVKDDGYLSILGSVVNNGTFTCDSSARGMFMGSNGSFTNNSTGILNINNRFDIMEGTLENSGSVSISTGNENVILCMGAVVSNKTADAVFTNEGSLDMGTSIENEGAVYERGTTFTNNGIFNNGGISTPSSSAYVGMMSGVFINAGRFVNNGNMDIYYSSFTHSAGTFDTYNTGGLKIIGSSFSTEGAPAGSFNNEGYMRVIDQYGKDGHDHICNIMLGDDTFNNDSNWLDYTASVYSKDGLTAAENAQQTKKISMGSGEGYFGLSIYNRLDFMADITVTESTALSAFNTYWVEDYFVWDGDAGHDVEVSVTLTVAEAATLTVSRCCSLNIGGALVNNGKIVTAAAYDEGDIHEYSGCVDIWPAGTFTNSGSAIIENNGDIYIRHEYIDLDDSILQANVTGIASVNAKFFAIVHNENDLIAANNCDSPVYDRIEIKGDSIIQLTGTDTLTIDKNVFIEPGSSLIVYHGKALELKGNHWIDNSGDMSVYGEMSIGFETTYFNRQSLEIGVLTGSEAATVTVLSGGSLINDGEVTVYTTGILDAGAGIYHGFAPNIQGGTYMGCK